VEQPNASVLALDSDVDRSGKKLRNGLPWVVAVKVGGESMPVFGNAILGLVAAAVIGVVAGPASAQTTTTFDQNYGATITNQYAGLTFNVTGGPGPSGAPCECSFGTDSIGNSVNGNYPTGSDLDVFFASAVSNVSGIFNNFGNNGDGETYGSYVEALDSMGNVVGYTNLSTLNGGEFSVAGSDIVELDFNNYSGGGYDWEFGLFGLTYTGDSPVPEPASIAALGMGIAALTMVRRRRSV
jgi:hypothetical protein